MTPDHFQKPAHPETPAPPFLRFHATKMLHTAQGPQLFEVRFELPQGQTLAIHGPSGSGKTTLLRILAGLTPADTGHIQVGSETWLDTRNHIDLPTRHRSIGFVFQDFALFPNLTVRGQLEYALPPGTRKAAKAAGSIIDELLQLMELEELQHRRPALLSGGQQQRIAIARAIARSPRLLILDEPLSALDDEMRHKLQDYLLKIQRHYHLTTLLVSHHLPEIVRLSDNVILLEKGRIERQGPPAEVFADKPHITITGVIIDLTPTGDTFLVRIDCAGTTVRLTVPAAKAATLQPGHTVTIASTLLNPNFITH
ncbi:MAG TPA: ATP-binding cassette domain-containing protein [Puia sp.]|nr:ATP-binding cassette domain-containing protein [Puia sp.]